MARWHKVVATALAIHLVMPITALPAAFAMSDGQDDEQHVLEPAELQEAMRRHADLQEAERRTIRRVLDHPSVRQIADAMGVDLVQARSAVDRLDSGELEELADHAERIEEELSGGDRTFTITATTLIIILLVAILIVLVAD